MSADVWLTIDTGGAEPARVTGGTNCTYNLTPMLREAGFCGWGELIGQTGEQSLPMLLDVQRTLSADPARFRALNPPNGWGDYDGLLRVVAELVSAAAEQDQWRKPCPPEQPWPAGWCVWCWNDADHPIHLTAGAGSATEGGDERHA